MTSVRNWWRRGAGILVGICWIYSARAQNVDLRPHAVHTLILVRHGAYDETAPDNATAPLIPLGIAQAGLTAARLQTLSAPAKILVSTMTRARQTADVLDQVLGVPQQPTDLLRECSPPYQRAERPAKSSTESEAAEEARCAGVLDRAFATYFRTVSEPETDVLVCHGNVIRYLVMKALGADTRHWPRFTIGHGSLTEIQVRPDGSMAIIMVGDVGHIPPILQSGTGNLTPVLEPEIRSISRAGVRSP